MGCFSLSTFLSWAFFGLKLEENTGLSGRQPGDSTGLKTKTRLSLENLQAWAYLSGDLRFCHCHSES